MPSTILFCRTQSLVTSHSTSGAWNFDEGEVSEASIPVFQFSGEHTQQHAQFHTNRTTVIIAAGIVRGHVGHFSHFLVDYVSHSRVAPHPECAVVTVVFAQVVPVLRALHAYRDLALASSGSITRECAASEACELKRESYEVWLDHLDQMASIPRRGFHSAFEEADADGLLGMKPWKTIYEGISHSISHQFTLLFVFGGMQMTTVGESDASALVMESELCFRANLRVLHSFRDTRSITNEQKHSEPSALTDAPPRALIISRNGTWWRRWLNEQVVRRARTRSRCVVFPSTSSQSLHNFIQESIAAIVSDFNCSVEYDSTCFTV